MGMKNRRFLAILFLSSALAVQAATVAVQVVESGPSLESGFLESSSAWEYGLMDALFNAGHIVSNAPIARLDAGLDAGTRTAADFMADTMQGVVEAKNGGADMLILAFLEYKSPSANPSPAGSSARLPAGSSTGSPALSTATRWSPITVTIRCISLNPVAVIAQETRKEIIQSRSGSEDQKNAAALMRNIISRLKER
jgi:hypothetical protein